MNRCYRSCKVADDANATLLDLTLWNCDNGYNLVVQGQSDAGLAMMEQGVAGTGLKFPEEAKLRLGMAYVMAGKKQKAIDTFKSITGSTGLTDLAKMWRLRAAQLAG